MNGVATFFRESSVGRFFIPLGIICIIVSICCFVIDNNNKYYIKTTAVVSKAELVEEATTDAEGNEVEATYKVYVKYTVDGEEYEEELGELSGIKKGDKMEILYNPKDPTQIAQPSNLLVSLVFLVVGIVSLIFGIVSSIKSIKKYKKLKAQEEGWKNGK